MLAENGVNLQKKLSYFTETSALKISVNKPACYEHPDNQQLPKIKIRIGYMKEYALNDPYCLPPSFLAIMLAGFGKGLFSVKEV